MRFALTVACAAWMMVCSVLPGHADKRVALVIGNAAYSKLPRLLNPKNDAEDVDAKLRQLGFETIVATDVDRAGFNTALDRFSRVVTGADIALVYYSGHGMQFAGTNYLLPVDASLDTAGDVNRFRLTPVDDVLETLKSAKGARVLVLDACRNNPVEVNFKRQLAAAPGANRDAVLTRGFKPLSAGNGLLIAYATQANDVANDGIGRNSPFTSAFLHQVDAPDIDLRTMLFRVQDEVDLRTNHQQRPELSISLIGEFKLKVGVPLVANPQIAAVTSPAGPSADEIAWSYVKDQRDANQLRRFIGQFPASPYRREAEAQLKELVVPPAAEVRQHAEQVILYEEDPADPAGKKFVGSAVWRSERLAPVRGQPAEVVVRADMDIPELKFGLRLTLRRNGDKSLPASHTIELTFTLPGDFKHKGIANVPGVLMKESENVRGVPLAGVAVKVATSFFLVGLSSVEKDIGTNVKLLNERPWLDIPIVYDDGRRAIMAVEKGDSGARAFAAWGTSTATGLSGSAAK